MRHFYFRFVIGMIWLAAAIVSAVGGEYLSMVLYIVLGAVFLYSAYIIRKKDKDHRG